MTNKEAKEVLLNYTCCCKYGTSPINCSDEECDFGKAIKTLCNRPQGECVDISKLRLMTVEECAGHTIDYAMGWKACIEWIKKGGAE